MRIQGDRFLMKGYGLARPSRLREANCQAVVSQRVFGFVADQMTVNELRVLQLAQAVVGDAHVVPGF